MVPSRGQFRQLPKPSPTTPVWSRRQRVSNVCTIEAWRVGCRKAARASPCTTGSAHNPPQPMLPLTAASGTSICLSIVGSTTGADDDLVFSSNGRAPPKAGRAASPTPSLPPLASGSSSSGCLPPPCIQSADLPTLANITRQALCARGHEWESIDRVSGALDRSHQSDTSALAWLRAPGAAGATPRPRHRRSQAPLAWPRAVPIRVPITMAAGADWVITDGGGA